MPAHWVDDIGDDGGEFAVLGNTVDIGGGLFGLFLLAFPLAVDAEQGSVNQMLSSDLTTMSFGAFNLLPRTCRPAP